MDVDKQDATALMQQICFFNSQFHESENQPYLQEFHELMRASKNRCQLMLLKFCTSEIVWVKKDLTQPNHEWLVGVYGQPDEFACHIPWSVLQKGLSEEQLAAWNIR